MSSAPDYTGEGGTPGFTLPDIDVNPQTTPAPSPSDSMTAGAGGTQPGLASSPPPRMSDAMITARLNGYQWPEIDQHIAQFQNTAAQLGHSQEDVDNLVGKPLDQYGVLPYTQLQLDPRLPTEGVSRPFGPGEYMRNPDGSWSNEMSDTAMVDGKPSVVPGLWLVNGHPMHLDEDQAQTMAQNSGLTFKSFNTEDEAQQFSDQRENGWQNMEPGSPEHFYTEPLWSGNQFPNALPNAHEAVDWPIGTIQASGMVPTLDMAKTTQANMLDMAIRANIPMADIYRGSTTDPLLQDALTSGRGDNLDKLTQQTINAYHAKQAIAPPPPTLQDIHNNDVGLEQWYVPGEDILHSKSMGEALKTAGLDAAMMAGGELAGKYVIAPLASKIMSLAGPALEDVMDSIKGTLADTAGSLGSGRIRRPPLPTAPSGINWTQERGGFTRLEDALYRLQTANTADRRTILKFVDALPKEWRETGFQEDAYHYQESMNPLNSTFERNPELDQYLDHVEPLLARERQLAIEVNRKLHGHAKDYDPTLQITSNREGYIHRMFDQEAAGTAAGEQPNPLGTKSLTRFASSMQERQQFFTYDNGAGQRVWGGDDLDKLPGKKYGDTFNDPVTNQTWKIAPATTEEIEANGKTLNGVLPAYIKQHIINTAENVARLSQINRNLDFLSQAGKELEAQGQFVHALKPAIPIGKSWDGKTIFSSPSTPKSAVPNGFKEVNVPTLDGWAAPRVADSLNQFYQSLLPSPALDWLRKMNRYIINLMFMNPIAHTLNIGTQWAMTRGWDWLNPLQYGSVVRNSFKAYNEVKNFGPLYEEHLRGGAGLQFARQETQNFMQLLHDKMIDTQSKAPWFESLAINMLDSIQHPYTSAKDAVSKVIGAQLDWSHRTMWAWTDMLALSRQLELREKGMPLSEAIFQSEKDISNYRVPAQVLKSETAQRFITDPAFDNFGRYHYGLVRSATLMANDFVRGTGGDRLAAVGKGLSLAFGAMAVLPLLSYGISTMGRAVTGDQSFKAEFMPSGLLSPIMNIEKAFTAPQGNWLSAVSSLMSINPLLSTAFQLATDKDVFGRTIFENKTVMGKIAAAAELGGNQIYPLQLALSLGRKGGLENVLGSILHFRKPVDPDQATKWQKRSQAEAFSQERSDGFENWLTGIFGGGPPAAKQRGTSGWSKKYGPGS